MKNQKEKKKKKNLDISFVIFVVWFHEVEDQHYDRGDLLYYSCETLVKGSPSYVGSF